MRKKFATFVRLYSRLLRDLFDMKGKNSCYGDTILCQVKIKTK